MSKPNIPLVGIGVPVYNAEHYLPGALDALLAQDFHDFEIIISDNASTDGTASICHAYAGRDPRIRYTRNEENIGASRNFARVCALARSPFFRWAASDDLTGPGWLGRCVAVLQAHPDVVLCQSRVRIVDEEDRLLGEYDGGLAGAESPDVATRFAALVLSRHLCTDIFGLMRTDALRRIEVFPDYPGSDRSTLAALGLVGRFVHLGETLFTLRDHPRRLSRATYHSMKPRALPGEPAPRTGPPTWELYQDYRRAVRTLVDDPADRRRCEALLRRWWRVDWNAARVAVDLAAGWFPGIYELVYRAKLHTVGPMPQLGLPRRLSGVPPDEDRLPRDAS